jgi:pyruvate dehydrogenase E1 component alpha subunit
LDKSPLFHSQIILLKVKNDMKPDLWSLYRHMYKSRLFEKEVTKLWEDGKISGEMHLGIGEEAIAAGVVTQMQEGDALALDHRGTPPVLMRGIDPVKILRELLGRTDGLCGGMGGHMHLFSREHLAASSGIVGASGPAAAGFALAAQYLRPGSLAVAFFGEGAANQGMMLETFNLAAVWHLPVIFMCKDNNWAIATNSSEITIDSLIERVESFGMPAFEVDGNDVEDVWVASNRAMQRARNGGGPTFLLASRIQHQPGHMLSSPWTRLTRQPHKQVRSIFLPILRSFFRINGAPIRKRLESLTYILSLIIKSSRAHSTKNTDPLAAARQKLKIDLNRLQEIESDVEEEIQQAVITALSKA